MLAGKGASVEETKAALKREEEKSRQKSDDIATVCVSMESAHMRFSIAPQWGGN